MIPSKGDGKGNRPDAVKETIADNPPATGQQQDKHSSDLGLKENVASQDSHPLLDEANYKKQSTDATTVPATKGMASTWASVKTNFENFKANIGPKKFLQLPRPQETSLPAVSRSESLDAIFERLKQKPKGSPADEFDFDDDSGDIFPKTSR